MSTMKVAGQMTAKTALFQNHKYFFLLIASIALSLMAEKVKQKGCNFRQCYTGPFATNIPLSNAIENMFFKQLRY